MPGTYDLDRQGLAELLDGEPGFRAAQVWEGLYRRGERPAEMTTLPLALRDRLEEELGAQLDEAHRRTADDGATIKWLFSLAGGAQIETVLMAYRDRVTVCVSTQAGCAMNCQFCATGQAGFTRQLSTGEILEQVMVARRAAEPRRLSNVVFMGMGEPLYNLENVMSAVDAMADGDGLSVSKRRITVSTSGVVPQIERLGAECGPMLAISLHAVRDELRDELVPLNKKYPIKELLQACRGYPGASNARRITFEYVMLKGANDSPAEARELVRLLKGVPAKINLIPFNPWPGAPYECSDWETIERFSDIVFNAGYASPVRTPRGRDILAACGQLKSETEKLRARARLAAG